MLIQISRKRVIYVVDLIAKFFSFTFKYRLDDYNYNTMSSMKNLEVILTSIIHS